MKTGKVQYELVRLVNGGDFRVVGTITDRDEAALLTRYLNDQVQGRTYLLRPMHDTHRRAE